MRKENDFEEELLGRKRFFETDKKYRRVPYVPNKNIEKNTTYWGENGLIKTQ